MYASKEKIKVAAVQLRTALRKSKLKLITHLLKSAKIQRDITKEFQTSRPSVKLPKKKDIEVKKHTTNHMIEEEKKTQM